MRLMIAGGSGLVGTALGKVLEARGDETSYLVRRVPRAANETRWNPGRERLDPKALEGFDAIVVLNGASVGKIPWTKSYRELLFSSRIDPVQTLVSALNEMGTKPPVLVSASATGFYGSKPGTEITEDAKHGETFLARLCLEWEQSAKNVAPITPVTLLRTAPIIHRDGFLRPMIRLTSTGLGGKIGKGSQVWPWISLEDEVRAITHVLDKGISGPINLCGPVSATAEEISKSLAKELSKPYWLPAPEWGLNLALGREATESLLTSDADVKPCKLLDSGFAFIHATADSAIKATLTATE